MNDPSRETLLQGLRGLRRRLRLFYLAHGTGSLLAGICAGILFSYGLDRLFHLPSFFRLAMLFVFSVAMAALFYRKIFFPLRRRLTETDLAITVERRFPELRDRVVSAIEIDAGNSKSPELTGDLYRTAVESLSHLPIKQVFDPGRPSRSLGLALTGMVLCLGVFLADRDAAGIWLRRFLGDNEPWPQQTFLDIHIAENPGSVRVTRNGGSVLVEMVRGADLPIRVTANGTVPDSVLLHMTGGATRTMLRTGEKEFNHIFVSVREPMRFWVTGGDDDDGEPRVEVIPDQPPELTRIAVRIAFPEYSRLEPVQREGGTIEALVGSRAEILAKPSREVARAVLRLQQSGEEIPLTPSPQDGEGTLRAEIEIKTSDRYSVELYNEKEIKGADSGSYPIIATPDRKPEIRLLSPSRSDFDATPRARVPIRAELTDDFGIRSALLLVKAGREGEVREISLLPPSAGEPNARTARRESVEWPLEISETKIGDRPPHEGEALFLRIRAFDNRSPEPNHVESGEVRILLVSEEEIDRRIQDNLTRIKEAVTVAESLQRERVERVRDLLTVVESEGRLADAEAPGLRSASVGQSRVSSSARAIAAQLLDTFETALFNRFHRDANAWIQVYEDGRKAARVPRSEARQDESTVDMLLRENRSGILAIRAASREGRLGVAEPLGKLSEMTEIALSLSEELSRKAHAAIESATLSQNAGQQKTLLAEAGERQQECLASMDRLLSMLAEWDNYQTVINLAKEILERQKSIQTRTKDWTRERK